jgi:hypothetical protein
VDYIDWERRTLLVPISKTGKPRVIALNGQAMALLRSIPRVDGNPYIFPSPITGRPCPSLHFPWTRIKQRAILDDLRLHDLRHSFASFLVNEGVSLYVVQGLLGHTQPRTTQRYAHLAQDTLNIAAEVVANVIAGAIKAPAGPIEITRLFSGSTRRPWPSRPLSAQPSFPAPAERPRAQTCAYCRAFNSSENKSTCSPKGCRLARSVATPRPSKPASSRRKTHPPRPYLELRSALRRDSTPCDNMPAGIKSNSTPTVRFGTQSIPCAASAFRPERTGCHADNCLNYLALFGLTGEISRIREDL